MADLPTPGSIKTGDVIAGRYEVRGMVGRGGMGRIYRVFDTVLGEEVALKTLLPDHIDDKVILDRFFNEAKIARSLSHPSIVRVHDIGRAGSVVYISMELLRGKSLRQMLDQVPPGQRLPIGGILRMFDALCAALDYAHRFTVHRDIKPENVMILENGSVKLMDFGISKLMSNPNLTSASIVMGTPHYMPPEQLKNTSAVDARADIYSVGVMLYEVLTGDRPAGLAKPASQISGEVPAALDPIIEKCCQSDPAKRYQSAAELRAALRAVRRAVERKTGGGEDSAPRARQAGRRPPSSAWRIGVAAVLLMAIAGVAVAGLGWAETRRRALIEASSAGLGGPPSSVADTESPAARFRRLSGEVKKLQDRADKAAEEYSPAQRSVLINPVIALGAELWAAAEMAAPTEPDRAVELGWDAAACYLAPLLWPAAGEMVFIPPSRPAEVGRARGFFIDARPLSADAFARFRESAAWRGQAGTSSATGDEPVSGVTFYDALAFVASARPAKRLPTIEEFDRALATLQTSESSRVWTLGTEPIPLGETGAAPASDAPLPARTVVPWLFFPGENYEGWGEWTSTAATGDAKAEDATFGDAFLTWGGHWAAETQFEADASSPMLFESSDAGIGLRGAMDLPRTFTALAALR
jgi:tRNA A-37 threonylcarbamoyl transferase component Bud32